MLQPTLFSQQKTACNLLQVAVVAELVDRIGLVLTAPILSSQRRVRLVVDAVGATKLVGWVTLSEAQRFSGDRATDSCASDRYVLKTTKTSSAL